MEPTDLLPLTDVFQPNGLAELSSLMESTDIALYPLGGQTSLDFGLIPHEPGIGVSLRQLNAVVDYPARDMTITVEAGITMQKLADTLIMEKQRLPIDAPIPEHATLGGLIATDFSGARRYGCGTLRDYVIGIQAVDANGKSFHSGGRVVKNVAGYDFCKLLTGSLGTLGIITQVTLKLKPTPASTALIVCAVRDAASAERHLGDLVNAATTPTAIELLAGDIWSVPDSPLANIFDADEHLAWLVIGLEGTAGEVDWMTQHLQSELGHPNAQVLRDAQASALWDQLRDFPTGDFDVIIKATTIPSGVVEMVTAARKLGCDIQAHAGDGVTICRFAQPPEAGLTRIISTHLMPIAAKNHGNVTVLAAARPQELTPTIVWGRGDQPIDMMTDIRAAFDPGNRLNPGRFVYRRAHQ